MILNEEKRLKLLQRQIEHYLALIGRCTKDNPKKAQIANIMYNSLMAEKQKILIDMVESDTNDK